MARYSLLTCGSLGPVPGGHWLDGTSPGRYHTSDLRLRAKMRSWRGKCLQGVISLGTSATARRVGDPTATKSALVIADDRVSLSLFPLPSRERRFLPPLVRGCRGAIHCALRREGVRGHGKPCPYGHVAAGCYRANTRFSPYRTVADSATGRGEGRSPSAFFSDPPLPKGDQEGLAWR